MPGVVAVLTAADFKPLLKGTHPVAPAFVPDKHTVPDRFPIADEEVCFQGEPVAVVVADNRKIATDGAQAVEVEYEPLPPVMDLLEALEPSSPKAHVGLADNLAWEVEYTGEDKVQEAFARADVVVKERILQQRLAPTPIEPRGVQAEYSSLRRPAHDLAGDAESALHPPVHVRARWAWPRRRCASCHTTSAVGSAARSARTRRTTSSRPRPSC